jgi:hypothetical protein
MGDPCTEGDTVAVTREHHATAAPLDQLDMPADADAKCHQAAPETLTAVDTHQPQALADG